MKVSVQLGPSGIKNSFDHVRSLLHQSQKGLNYRRIFVRIVTINALFQLWSWVNLHVQGVSQTTSKASNRKSKCNKKRFKRLIQIILWRIFLLPVHKNMNPILCSLLSSVFKFSGLLKRKNLAHRINLQLKIMFTGIGNIFSNTQTLVDCTFSIMECIIASLTLFMK